MNIGNEENRVIKLPRAKKASRRIAKALTEWFDNHKTEKWKKVILVCQSEDGSITVADAGFRKNEEHLFRGMLDYVKGSWDWDSENEN